MPAARNTATLRWGLLLEELPGATYTPEVVDAADVGIDTDFCGSTRVCRVTIEFPDGRAPVSGWQEVGASATKTPGAFDTVTMSALDRALTNAGYPPDVEDLRFLMRWRFRKAEVGLLDAQAFAELSRDSQASLQERTPPTTPTEPGPEDIDTAMVPRGGDTAGPELVEEVVAAIEQLALPAQHRLREFLAVAQIEVGLDLMSVPEARMVLKAIRNIGGALPQEPTT